VRRQREGMAQREGAMLAAVGLTATETMHTVDATQEGRMAGPWSRQRSQESELAKAGVDRQPAAASSELGRACRKRRRRRR
jgi:hypothetical protein